MIVESLPGRVTVAPWPGIVVTRVCVTTFVMTFPGRDTVEVRPGKLTVFAGPLMVEVLVCVTLLVLVTATPVTVL